MPIFGTIPSTSNVVASAITGTLGTSQLADSAITSAKIADAAITAGKVLASQVFVIGYGGWPSGNNQNLNDVTTAGGYGYVPSNYSGTTNTPPVYGYGTLLVFNVGSFLTQMVFPHFDQSGYYRTKYMAGDNNTYWISWKAFT